MEQSKTMVKGMEVKRLPPTLVNYFDKILQLVLFVIFLVLFGIPSVCKYLDKETMIIFAEEETDGIEAPAITFLGMKNWMGWKSVNNVTNSQFNIVDHCKEIGFTDLDLETCTANDTFGLADFLKEAKIGALEPQPVLNESALRTSSLWTADVTATPYGRHFTLKLGRTITRNNSDFVIFRMDSTSSFYYSVWVHDENFFLVNMNPFRKEVCENVMAQNRLLLPFSVLSTLSTNQTFNKHQLVLPQIPQHRYIFTKYLNKSFECWFIPPFPLSHPSHQ